MKRKNNPTAKSATTKYIVTAGDKTFIGITDLLPNRRCGRPPEDDQWGLDWTRIDIRK